MAFIITRINVGDYDRWKPMFEQDAPGAAARQRATESCETRTRPNEVCMLIEYGSVETAKRRPRKLLASGVLERFDDRDDPKVFEDAEQVDY